ncbi:MAG: hypothetical protein P1U68_08065 [Verrucomicrobiales bacterium]|nr:hypothetical protein [Verrucomicrobiales bacterium]
MPKHEQIPGERWRQRTPKRIVRWLLRFLAWSSLITLIAVFLVSVVAFFVYLNRAKIVNDALALFVAPFDVSVGTINLYPIGEVSIENLQLSPKGTDFEEPTFSVPGIKLTYDFQALRLHRQLKSVRFEKPVIHLTDESLTALSANNSPGPDLPAPIDFAKFAVFTESLSLNDGELFLDLDGLPGIAGTWSVNTPAFSFDEEGRLLNPIKLTLSNLALGDAKGGGEIKSISTGLILNRDLSRFEIPFLQLTGIEANITPEWFARNNESEASGAGDSTGSSQSPNPVEWLIRSVEVGESTFSITGFDGSNGSPSLPEMAFDTGFSLPELRLAGGQLTTPDALSLELTDIAIGQSDAQLASAARLRFEAESIQKVLNEQTFSFIQIDDLEVVMTDKTLERCRGGTNEEPATDEEQATDASEPGLPWIIDKLTLNDGRFLMRDTTFGETEAPHLETAIAGTLRDLRFGGEDGFASDELTEIRLSKTQLRAPGHTTETDPLLTLDRAEIAGKWSDFTFDNQLERLALRGPKINFTDETLGSWLTMGDSAPETTGPVNRPVYKIADLEVSDGKLVADSQFAAGKVPKIYADFSISTDKEPDAVPFDYDVTLEDFQLRNHSVAAIGQETNVDSGLFPDSAPAVASPGVNEGEVLSVKKIELSATAEALQRTRQVDRVKVIGAILRVGDGLKAIADSGMANEPDDSEPLSPPAPEPAQEDLPELPTWMLKEVEITQSQVRFEALIPQISGLEFAIETKLTDIPLSPDGLIAQEKLQKIELAGIEIKDPYNSFITVAFLPTIFVEFSLAGLANQEIEKIDLIGPALHVGQGLFWWIDYQRKFREQNEGASVGLDEDSPTGDSPDWEIKTINATAGKIVIAPTGIPIGMVPFPFNATTNMQDGRIELKLNIPDEEGYVYQFPDYEVNLYGLTGNIEFNVPIQQVSNNIVQVFELDRFVWKDYEAEDLYLSVTFDENGVYGELGGKAYGGYAEGGFNFYLNDPGKWDAWVAGTEMDTRPITQVLVPDNFEMEGLVSLKLLSEGRDKELGESSGEIQTVGPGWFDVTKFDAILDELPEEWSSLQRSLTELGLIALKRFDYDKGAGSLYLLGQEGNLDLRFAGSYGTRELNLHLHDNRNTTPPVTQHTDNDNLSEMAAEPASEDP